MGTSRIEIKPARPGERAAFTIRALLQQPFATSPTLPSPITGDPVPVPEGSLQQFFAQHRAAFGGEDAYVKLVFRYTPSPGEQPRRQLPAGWKIIPSASI